MFFHDLVMCARPVHPGGCLGRNGMGAWVTVVMFCKSTTGACRWSSMCWVPIPASRERCGWP